MGEKKLKRIKKKWSKFRKKRGHVGNKDENEYEWQNEEIRGLLLRIVSINISKLEKRLIGL